jgi:hypothetical protein
MALPDFVRATTHFLLTIGKATLPYLPQVFLGVLAFFALFKDWKNYGTLSRKWGRSVPLVTRLV